MLSLVLALLLAGKPSELPEPYRAWLEEEVRYEITKPERAAFLELTSDAQREGFIELFWEHRDPTPGTPANEAREEHQRRWEYVQRSFGRGTHRKAWLTDRGRIYMLLGEPVHVKHYTEAGSFRPMELWFYDAPPQAVGELPPQFYLLFYRKGAGDYRLYDPFTDGPRALATGPTLEHAPLQRVLDQMRQEVDYEVAHASLSFDPGDAVDFNNPQPSLGNALILQGIEELPNKIPPPDYAEALAAGRELVRTRYTFASLPATTYFAVLYDRAAQPFLHFAWQLAPQDVSMGEHDGRYYFAYDVSLQLIDPEGKLVDTFTDLVSSYMSAEEYEKRKAGPIAYENRVPIITGRFRAALTLRDRIKQTYATFQTEVSTWEGGELGLSEIQQGFQLGKPEAGKEFPFELAGVKFLPNLTGEYLAGAQLWLLYQILEPNQTGVERQAVYRVVQDDRIRVEETNRIEPSEERTHAVVKNLLLPADLRGPFRVELQVAEGKRVLASRTATGTVVDAARILRPQFLIHPVPSAGHYGHDLRRAQQDLRLGRIEAACALLRQGLIKNSASGDLRRLLGRVLIQQKQEVEAIEVLEPLFREDPNDQDGLKLLAFASEKAGRLEDAVRYWRILLRQQETVEALNELSQVYLALGQESEARPLLERSLALSPDQDGVRSALARLQ
jgi:GWxTD domain-containing protein